MFSTVIFVYDLMRYILEALKRLYLKTQAARRVCGLQSLSELFTCSSRPEPLFGILNDQSFFTKQ